MSEFKGLVFVMLPKHVEDSLGLLEILRRFVHENLLNFRNSASEVIFRNLLVGIVLCLIFFCRSFFKIIEQTIFGQSSFLFEGNFLAVQHDKHEIFHILETLGSKVVEYLADVVVSAPYEHNTIIDELVS